MNFKAFLQENSYIHKTFTGSAPYTFSGLVEHVCEEFDEFIESANANESNSAIDEFFDLIRMGHALLIELNISETEIIKGYWANREKLKKRGVLFD